MKTTDKFTYKSPYKTYNDCYFAVGRYNEPKNNYLAIVNDEEGEIITCSVNLDRNFDKSVIAIKNYSENKGIDDFLKEIGVIGDVIGYVRSGWVEVPIYELTESGLELFENEH